MRDFMLRLKWVNSLLVWTFEVGRQELLIWAMLPADSIYKDTEGGSFCCFSGCPHLTITPTLSLALESVLLGFQSIQKTS